MPVELFLQKKGENMFLKQTELFTEWSLYSSQISFLEQKNK